MLKMFKAYRAFTNKTDNTFSVHSSNNITSNYSENDFYDELPLRHSSEMTFGYCVAYVLIFVIGFLGNCFVITVVLKTPRMQTVTNFFIVNLAIADILVIIFCLPATLLGNIFVPWVLGWFMCKLVPYIQGVSVTASVYSLIAVSLDRFIAIWWPIRQLTKRRARVIIILIWAIASTSTLPWAIYFELIPAMETYPEAPELLLCTEVWPPEFDGNLYFLLANLISCYLLPMLIIIICYALIWIKVCKRTVPGEINDKRTESLRQKSKIKVMKMIATVVIVFIVSWLPLYSIFIRIKFGGEISKKEENVIAMLTPVAQWLGSSNSCINPILYAFLNKKYRRALNSIFRFGKCCGPMRNMYIATASSSSTAIRRSLSKQKETNTNVRRAYITPAADINISDNHIRIDNERYSSCKVLLVH